MRLQLIAACQTGLGCLVGSSVLQEPGRRRSCRTSCLALLPRKAVFRGAVDALLQIQAASLIDSNLQTNTVYTKPDVKL